MRGWPTRRPFVVPILQVAVAACCWLGATWTAGCASGDARDPAVPAAGGGRCLEGTRWEPRLASCVADAPDDDSVEAMCADEALRPTRDIIGEVQDLERERAALAADDPVRRDLAGRLARGYDELGCATLREATDAESRSRHGKHEPDEAARLEDTARRARKIHDAARAAALKYRREVR